MYTMVNTSSYLDTCVHLLKSTKAGGNPVQTYLDTLSLSQVMALKQEVEDALEQCEDSSRCMTAYQGGENILSRVRKQCFSRNGTPLKPHKQDDRLKKLHARLGCHNLEIGLPSCEGRQAGSQPLVHLEDAHFKALTSASTESQPSWQGS